ncbi:TraQ conjugal transfer family protein [Chryseobacterium oncorhynchi]|uniref:Uncharacterized protein n=1 Tax=Chryseobacterium oncorhynchi TaxID=741074 RepID=A0A316WDR7_9FLAO|nr:TraQ conjugal transfer family protein [Chryseobacterium oncorhynchi]PWN59189.1 hypothetical protein C1638_021520 [Chryseobacterium oncorhynchi]
MKKILKLLAVFFAIAFTTFSFNSCSEDGDWEDGNGGQFGFTIEKDSYFIEKAVGETNQVKFNIKPNYNFQSIQTTFKFTTNLNGVLKLNGQVLNPNQEYTFTNKDNIFEYTGNVAGDHLIKISVKNSKGFSKDEEISLKYGISEFTHTYTGGTADIYQSDETPYVMKVVPSAGQPTTGYEIKFNSYNGTIKLNGVAVQTGQFYPLPNLNSFTVTLATNQVGQGALDYDIKNATVSKNYNIQQTVIARKIVIESMNINALNVIPNTQMSLIGVVKKTPVTPNTSVKYKTWISASSNNNANGIQNTNNVYTPFALGANGAFSLNFNAIEVGTYTYNIQFQDEFGNESDVKSFNISVDAQLQFVGGAGAEIGVYAIIGVGSANIFHKTFKRTFKVVSGGSTTITKMKYTIDLDIVNGSGNVIGHWQRVLNENVSNGTNTYEVQDQNLSISDLLVYSNAPSGVNFSNIVVKMEATNSNNATVEKTVTGTAVVL